MNTLQAWLMIIGSLMGFLAVGLSFIWQRMDFMADHTIAQAQRVVRELLAQGHRPADISEAEANALRYKRIAAWIRPVGVFCLYGSMVLIFFAILVMGINALEP